VANEISSEYSVSTSEVSELSIINPVDSQKNKSSVWAHFSLLTNKQKAICNYCKYQLSHKKSTRMSHLHRHLKSCRKYQKSVFKKGSAELPKGQMQLEFSPTIKPSNDSIRKNLVDMIIRDELSFHADMVKRDVIKAYDIRKVYIKEILQNAKGKISLTCDIWRLLQQLEYLSITAHFLDKNWNLIFILLLFRLIPFPHSGINIANCIKVATDKYLITNKLQTITLDNASSNDVAIHELADHIFQNFYSNMNLCEYKSESLVIPSLDCDTRWNFTYKMLQLAIKIKNVIIRMKDRNKTFPNIPDEKEWKKADNIYTLKTSANSNPTLNNAFASILNIHTHLLSMRFHTKDFIRNICEPMIEKFNKY
ncbi:21102_t:CDS:2, partial [Cetraspora pellucida]